MATQEIQRDHWGEFFDGFSRRHKGWLVTVEVLEPDIGDQIEARDLPLEGISIEEGRSGVYEIGIFAGAGPESHTSHRITGPTHVRVKRSDIGADEALEIESGRTKTLVRFRSAVPPETVDGIV